MAASFDAVCDRAAAYANRHGRKLSKAEAFIKRAWGPGTFGVEYVSIEDRELAYVNTGDTYSVTVAREGHGDVFVTSWGDWYEAAEAEYEQDNDVIRCGYCGAFTPLCEEALAQPEGARHSWSETVCESCGHKVDGSK